MNLIENKLENLKIESTTELTDLDYLKKANAFFNIGKYIEAIEYYDKILALNVTTSNTILATEAYYRRSFSFLRIEKFHQSIQSIDLCLALDPHYVIAYVTKGFCYKLLNRVDESNQMFEKAMSELDLMSFDETDATKSDNEKYKEFLLNKGLSYRGLKQYDKAMECYDKLIEIGDGPKFENG